MNMWKVLLAGACMVFLAVGAASASSQLTPNELRVLEKIKGNEQKRQAALGLLADRPSVKPDAVARETASSQAGSAQAAVPRSQVGDPNSVSALLSKHEKNSPAQYSKCAGFNILLRLDWKDIGYLSCPDSIDKAAGAQLSFTDDRVARNKNWAAHGTVAAFYNSVTDDPKRAIVPYDTSIGIYTTLDRSFNTSTAQAKNNVDTVAWGGLVELGFVTSTGANYFRVRGGGVEDNLKGMRSYNFTGEWLPVYYPLHIHEPFQPFGLPLIVRFDPVLLAQFAEAEGRAQRLNFNGMYESFRTGPQLTLKLFPLPGGPDFVTRLHGSATYHPSYETYSRAWLRWYQASLTYDLDNAGYFGITGTYQRGTNEDTGANTDIYKLALSGKL